MKTAVLLLSNRTDCAVLERYEKLAADCAGKYDVYLLFDATKDYDVQGLSRFARVYPFDIKELVSRGYKVLKSGFLGNCHCPVLAFHSDHPEYGRCWVLEDDAVFSGDWTVLFDTFADDGADLVATKVRRYYDEVSWPWWPTLKNPLRKELPKRKRYAAFIPVYRLSSGAMDCLEKMMRRGWRGFFEGLIPTCLMRKGLTLRDINGKGFGLEDRGPFDFYSEDTHTWTPLRIHSYCPDKIYHPIKEKIARTVYRRFCLIAEAEENSRGMPWMDGGSERNYDIHLLVRDMSFGRHYDEADFAYGKAGSRWDVTKDYFDNHPYLAGQYDYFLFIDYSCRLSFGQVNDLFDKMVASGSEISVAGGALLCLSKKMMLRSLSDDSGTSLLFFRCQ